MTLFRALLHAVTHPVTTFRVLRAFYQDLKSLKGLSWEQKNARLKAMQDEFEQLRTQTETDLEAETGGVPMVVAHDGTMQTLRQFVDGEPGTKP